MSLHLTFQKRDTPICPAKESHQHASQHGCSSCLCVTLISLLCRFRRISQLYSQGVRPLARDSLELQNWNWLYNATDKLTKGWLSHGSRLLQQVTASAKGSEEAMQVLSDRKDMMHRGQVCWPICICRVEQGTFSSFLHPPLAGSSFDKTTGSLQQPLPPREAS